MTQLVPSGARLGALEPTGRYGQAPEAHGSVPLTIASYNIHKCVGTDGVFDPKRIKQVLLSLNADIIALQEADARFGDRRGLLDLDVLMDLGGYRAVENVGSRDLSHGWHGNVVLYRNAQVRTTSRLRLPGVEPRGALVVDFDVEGVAIRVIAVHLGLLRRSRSKQLSSIVDAAEPRDRRPVIVLGDMNEWRVNGRSVINELRPHLMDAGAPIASFPSRFPILPLDRILVNHHLTVLGVEAVNTPQSRIASDHLPLRATVLLKTAADAVASG